MESTRHEQFVALFVRHEAAIHSFILTMLPSYTDSEEVLQETSLTLWRRFDQFEEGTSFRNWAFQVAKFTVFNYVRKLGRDRHRFSEKMMMMLAEHSEQKQEDLESRRRILDHCISKLPDKDRTVLAGCYTEKTTIKDYALNSGRTPNAVTKQLNRIRKSLVQCVRSTLRTQGSV